MASPHNLPESRPAELSVNASSICSDRAPADPAKPMGPSVDRYLHRISIEGMDYYLRATSKFERRFWLLIILVGMGGTLVYLIPAFTQYLDFTTVFQIEYRTSPDLIPPNTWICRRAVNYSYLYDRFDRVKPQLGGDKRVQLFVKRLTAIWLKVYGIELTVDGVLDITMSFITMAPFEDNLDWRYVQPQLLNEVLNKAIEAMGSEWTGIRTFYEEGFFDCPSYLRKCTLNGITIDCCRDSVSGYNNQANKCYKIDIRRELQDRPNLLKRGEPIELSIEASADTRYNQRDHVEASGVLISFQTQIPNGYDERINPLAAGSASKINVKGTRKNKISDCIEQYRYNPKSHVDADPLVQQYFKDMQEQKKYSMEYCASGRLIEAMSIRCGCVPYIDTLKPNDTVICTPAHIYACYYSAFLDTPEMEALEKDAAVHQQKEIFVDLINLIASACLPLCDTWSYEADVFSTIMDGDEGNISVYWRNKMTVTFDPEYRVETEMLQMDLHAFIASLGDGLGLMLGMSFISFVQLAVWIVAALCFRRRLRRVGPLVEEDVVVKFDQIPQQNETHMNAGSNPKVTITITEVG